MTERIERLTIDGDSWLEITNLSTGVFAPLRGFMTRKDNDSVVREMHTAAGEPWTIPVTLEVPEARLEDVRRAARLQLCTEHDTRVADLEVEDVFLVDYDHDLRRLFGTEDRRHPGLRKELSRSPWRVGGRVTAVIERDARFPGYDLTPEAAKAVFRERDWRTVVGFQTRNPPHRAHEHLQRTALELFDGLFIQPLIGWKQTGDFLPEAIVRVYETQITFYPRHKVLLGTLLTPMRYAGPREAVFHAIIRRNYGCTHFIVGRDHAGVGNFYGTYDAQALCRQFTNLGIVVVPLGGPYFCTRCAGVVTEHSCGCGTGFAVPISGTRIRECLRVGELPPASMMRPEIGAILADLDKAQRLFCD